MKGTIATNRSYTFDNNNLTPTKNNFYNIQNKKYSQSFIELMEKAICKLKKR
jgi:hypothetical protein